MGSFLLEHVYFQHVLHRPVTRGGFAASRQAVNNYRQTMVQQNYSTEAVQATAEMFFGFTQDCRFN